MKKQCRAKGKQRIKDLGQEDRETYISKRPKGIVRFIKEICMSF